MPLRTPLRTPLYELHAGTGAKMIEFGGWEMPLQYESIVEEHLTVRRDAGLFDVSHMGKVLVTGSTAGSFLAQLSTNDLPTRAMRARYTHFLDADGHILDDVIITRLAEDRYFVVCNAAPRERILAWMEKHRPKEGVEIRDYTPDLLCLALQGPKAARVLQILTPVDLGQLKGFQATYGDLLLSTRLGTDRMAPAETVGWDPLAPEAEEHPGDACLITRTGYTGEDGFELFPPRRIGAAVWKAMLAAGRDAAIRPAGLGARDTLRLEKGFLLSGTDFDGRQTSLEASSEWLVKWDHDFIGRQALRRQKELGDYDRLVGLLALESGIPRRGSWVLEGRRNVGIVTSGTFSPSLRIGIALAYVRPQVAAEGTELAVAIRDRRVRAKVTKPPFV